MFPMSYIYVRYLMTPSVLGQYSVHDRMINAHPGGGCKRSTEPHTLNTLIQHHGWMTSELESLEGSDCDLVKIQYVSGGTQETHRNPQSG
jgi:hypothetical protein